MVTLSALVGTVSLVASIGLSMFLVAALIPELVRLITHESTAYDRIGSLQVIGIVIVLIMFFISNTIVANDSFGYQQRLQKYSQTQITVESAKNK